MPPEDIAATILIRPLEAGDSLEALTALVHRAYARLARMGLNYTATDQSVEVTAARVAAGQCFVACAGRRIVGTVVFRTAAETNGCAWYDRPEVASFGQLAVEPECQSQGLGRRLIALAEIRAIESGAEELALDTAEPATHLVDWYARQGYRPVETAQWRGKTYRSVIMSKRLGGPGR